GRDVLDHALADLRPQIRRREDARRSRTLLALVLEAAADDCGRDRLGIRGWMRDNEVLAARLTDDARVVPVVGDVRADRLPHRLEDGRRAGEEHAGEVRAGERRVADLGA